MFRRILVPTNGSRGSRAALQAAIELARLSGGRLYALHVVPPVRPEIATMGVDNVLAAIPVLAAVAEPVAREHDAALGEAQSAAREAGIPVEAEQLVDPRPHNAIVESAERHECDLIVMASQGYGDILSIVTGSTTAKVVSGCDVPVLVVH